MQSKQKMYETKAMDYVVQKTSKFVHHDWKPITCQGPAVGRDELGGLTYSTRPTVSGLVSVAR